MKLPDLIEYKDHDNCWDKYIEAVYSFFKQDFIDDSPLYEGVRVSFAKEPLFRGKEAGFWHLTSRGKEEKKRTPDFRKCEKIRWIRPLIESSKDPSIKFWISQREEVERICLCYGDWEYLVVLCRGKKHFLLVTAHPIDYPHTKRKLEKEYNSYKKQEKENIA